jgi:succinate-semialdehyde dehydrogenase/glutarate-semialdehyde dehydrogenase
MGEGNIAIRDRSSLALERADLFNERCYVNGKWIDSSTGRSLEVVNPANGSVIGTVPIVASCQVEDAIAGADAAFANWRAQTPAHRAKIVFRWFELVQRHAEDLATIVTAENGKPLKEARGEVAYAASFLQWFAEEARRSYGDVIPSPVRNRTINVIKQPVGTCAAITPWNFPLAMVTRKAGPALAAGCTMILKPAEQTPFSALALARLAEEAGVPPGVFNVVTGEPKVIGAVLTDSSTVRKLTFTGSTPVGVTLMAQCASTVKRLSLELGGNAPVLVFDDADIERSLEGALIAKFRNSGQSCVGANRIYVQRGIYAEFARRFAARVSQLRQGDGFGENVDIGPLIDVRAVEKVQRHVDDAVARGATVMTGGRISSLGPTFFEPTVLANVPADALLTQEETFGPVAALIPFDTVEEAITLANATPFGLAAYLFTDDLTRAMRVSERIESGMVGVNTGLISSEVGPFGGIKMSGLGREGSKYGMDEYMELKYICFDSAELEGRGI